MHAGPIKTPSELLNELQNQTFFTKYKELIFAAILFVILNVVVLILNYYTAIQLQNDGQAINLAGRQRMLSQKMVKELYLIQDLQTQTAPLEEAIKDFNKTYELFDGTLNAFKMGGTAINASNIPVLLTKVNSPKGLAALEKATALWEPYKNFLKPILLSTGEISPESLAPAIAYAKEQNVSLLKEMNNLTVDLEANSAETTRRMRTVQAIALVLIILIFSFIIFNFLTKIKKSDRAVIMIAESQEKTNLDLETANSKIRQAQAETGLMFTSIKQGLFLINQEYKIGSQYTNELKTMFQIDDLEGMSFIGILQRLLPEKMYRISRDYIEMLFDPTKKEKALMTVNPLDEIEVNFTDPKGGFITKFFEFSFRRITNPDKSIHRVFITVRDTTKQAQLTRQLHESEKKKERQFELLFAILHVEAAALSSFTQSTRQTLEEMNQELKAEDFVGVTLGIAQDAMLRQRLDSLFRKIHTVKGAAGYIGLDYFVNLTHEIENKIEKLKNTPKLSGEDFLGIVLQKSEMKAALDEIEELHKKLIEMKSISPITVPENKQDPLQSGLEKLVESLQIQTDKNVRIEFDEFEQKKIPQKHLPSVRDVMIQLIRNSFAHGIEDGKLRSESGKDPIATIYIGCSLQEKPGFVTLTYRDDGQGLDIERIRSICIRKNFITPEESKDISDDAIVPYIFHSGFSTQEGINTLSGRGVGLNIVSNEIITKIGGDLFVNFEKGSFCEFIMEIPV